MCVYKYYKDVSIISMYIISIYIYLKKLHIKKYIIIIICNHTPLSQNKSSKHFKSRHFDFCNFDFLLCRLLRRLCLRSALALRRRWWTWFDDSFDAWPCGCFLKWWYPQIIHFNRGFSIINHPVWGTPNFWKHLYELTKTSGDKWSMGHVKIILTR